MTFYMKQCGSDPISHIKFSVSRGRADKIITRSRLRRTTSDLGCIPEIRTHTGMHVHTWYLINHGTASQIPQTGRPTKSRMSECSYEDHRVKLRTTWPVNMNYKKPERSDTS